jgi:hypothetical protein
VPRWPNSVCCGDRLDVAKEGKRKLSLRILE